MARANANGTTWHIPEGAPVPTDVPEGVRLVGPGVEVEPEPESVVGNPTVTVVAEPVKEVASSQPDTTSSRSTGKTKNG